jgi:hypothetical protein
VRRRRRPLFVTVVVAQALTRTGFDLTHDAASLLDDGPWGLDPIRQLHRHRLLLIAAAAGLRRTLRTGPGHKWIPRLLTLAGAGMSGGGVFHPDPSGEFPAGASAIATWLGVASLVCGSPAFLALITVCFVMRPALPGSRQAVLAGAPAGQPAAGLLTSIAAPARHAGSGIVPRLDSPASADRRTLERTEPVDLDALTARAPSESDQRRAGREDVDSASGPASEVLAWCGRRV